PATFFSSRFPSPAKSGTLASAGRICDSSPVASLDTTSLLPQAGNRVRRRSVLVAAARNRAEKVPLAVMVTADEIAGIAVFAELSEADRERISLAAGEYAAYEGGERALFGLLEGKIEAVKHVEGIGRVVGVRAPGDIFGEVP